MHELEIFMLSQISLMQKDYLMFSMCGIWILRIKLIKVEGRVRRGREQIGVWDRDKRNMIKESYLHVLTIIMKPIVLYN